MTQHTILVQWSAQIILSVTFKPTLNSARIFVVSPRSSLVLAASGLWLCTGSARWPIVLIICASKRITRTQQMRNISRLSASLVKQTLKEEEAAVADKSRELLSLSLASKHSGRRHRLPGTSVKMQFALAQSFTPTGRRGRLIKLGQLAVHVCLPLVGNNWLITSHIWCESAPDEGGRFNSFALCS